MPRILLSVAAVFLLCACEPERPARRASKGPPANAEYVTDSPVSIIRQVASSKSPAAADEFIGKWNSDQGWDGVVEAITEDKSGTVLRMNVYEATLVGGSYWILAIVGDNPDIEKGKQCRVQGKIREVSSKVMGGANVVHRIVLEDARIVK